MFFIWIILIGAVIYYLYKEKGSFSNTDSAQKKLRERFVAGEIDEETYLRMKELLK